MSITEKVITLSKKRKVYMTVFFGVFLALAFLTWVGHKMVTGQEEKRMYIFPTSVESHGWEQEMNALEQSLGDHAGIEEFTRNNSAFISIGGTPTDIEQIGIVISDQTNNKGTESDGNNADTTDSAGLGDDAGTIPENIPSSDPPSIEPASPINTQSDVEETVESVPEIISPSVSEEISQDDTIFDVSIDGETVSLKTVRTKDLVVTDLLSWVEKKVVGRMGSTVFAQEDLSFESVTATSLTTENVDEGIGVLGEEYVSNIESVASCTILGKECHTLRFSGFDVGTSLADYDVGTVQLRFSFASKAPFDEFSKDTFVVRYFYNESWHVAGEFTLEGEYSNDLNGGYFLYSLPKLGSWDELEDLHIEVEYNRSVDGPTDLFLDGIWLEAVYKEPQAWFGSSDNEVVIDTGSNVTQVLHDPNNKTYDPNVLPVSLGKDITFDYTDDNTNETLVIKTNKESYGGLTQEDIYFSVTNTGAKAERVSMQMLFPQYGGDVANLQRWVYNVPVETESLVYGESAYLCEGGWVQSQEKKEYLCESTGEIFACDVLNSEGTNCIINDMYVGVENGITYIAQWDDVETAFGPMESKKTLWGSSDKNSEGLSGGLVAKTHTRNAYTIEPDQTLYFKMKLAHPSLTRGEFVIEASGSGGGYGILDPWWNAQWSEQAVVTVTNNTEQELHNVVVPVIIDGTYEQFWEKVKADGGDIRFTDSAGNELEYFVTLWDFQSRTARILVRVPYVVAQGTGDITLFVGNTNAETMSDPYGLFTYAEEQEVQQITNVTNVPQAISVRSL